MLPLLVLLSVSVPVQTPILEGRGQRAPYVGADHALPVSIEFGGDGVSVFSIRTDGIVQRWSLDTGDLLSSFGSSRIHFRSATVSPEGTRVAFGDEEGVLRIWEANELAPTRILQAHRSPISRIVWSPDARRMVTFGYQRDMALWDAETGKSIARFHSLDEKGSRACAAFTSDGSRLVFSVGEEFIRVCSADTGELLYVLAGNEGGVSSLCLASNGTLLAATTIGGADQCGRCHVWNIDDGKPLAVLGRESQGGEGQFDPIVLARFSDDGPELTTMDAFGFVEVHCGEGLEPNGSFQIPDVGGWPSTCYGDYLPRTDLLVPAIGEASIQVVRPRTGSGGGILACDAPAAVLIHPSGRFILTVSGHVLRVFDVMTLNLRLTRVEYENGNWLCLTPDLHFSGTPTAEAWARVGESGEASPAMASLDPSFRNPVAVRGALHGD